MEWNIVSKPSYSLLKMVLEPGESVTAEPGALVYMSEGINVKTHTGGGLGKALMRALFGGESVFLNTYTARSRGELWLAPSLPGDVEYVALDSTSSLIIQDTSYLAHHGNIDLSMSWRGFRGLLAEGELVWLKASGVGGVWVSAYGGIISKKLNPREKIIVDNFHFVAMDSTVKWRVRKFGGIKSFLFGGEGFVIEAEGPGRILVQTRSLPPFAEALTRFIRRK